MKSHVTQAVVLCIAVCGIGGLLAVTYTPLHRAAATEYFHSMLLDAGAQEIHAFQETFHIQSGAVLEEVSARKEYEIMRLAYAAWHLRREPIVSLPLSDLEHVTTSIRDLSAVVKRMQEKNTAEAAALEDLFPLDFLSSLTNAEEKRRAFLAETSAKNLEAYLEATAETLATRSHDLERFRERFDAFAPDERTRLASIGGIFSIGSLRAAYDDTQVDTALLEERLHAQVACLDGHYSFCSDAQPSRDALRPDAELPDSVPMSVRDIQRFRNDVYTKSSNPLTIALTATSCTVTEESPHFFTIWKDGGDDFLYTYDNDIYLLDLEKLTYPVFTYQRQTLGISYGMLSPFVFYQCPDLARVTGELYAIARIAEFATSHPEIVSDLRAQLLFPHAIDRREVATYLASARDALAPHAPEMHELEELELALRNKNAGVEFLLDDIVRVFNADLRNSESGAPFDFSARVLFGSRNATLSLLFAHDPSSIPTSFRDAATPEASHYFESVPVRRYSDLVERVPREKLLSDVRRFFAWEDLMP